MIEDFLSNHPGLYLLVGFLYILFEFWIGKTKLTRASSGADLLLLAINKLFGKDSASMSPIVKVQEQQAKETKDVVDLVLALARDFQAGVKTSDMVGKEIGVLMEALKDSDQIRVEMKENPVAFSRTVFAGVGELVAMFMAGLSPKA